MDENWERSRVFKNCKIGNFVKCTKWPQTKFKESGIKSTFHMSTIKPQVPNFHQFCSTISRFQDIPHFTFSRWLPCKNCATKFLKLGRLPKKVPCSVLIKFGWHQMKTVGGEEFWNFQPHMVLCSEKFQSAIEFLIFGRLPKKVIAYISPRLWYLVWSLVKFWWKLLKE